MNPSRAALPAFGDAGLFPPEDRALFQSAWETARANQGLDFTFYLPGMIKLGLRRGRYPAISLTGASCRMMCEHCKGRLLEPLLKVSTPDEFLLKARRLKQRGSFGLLLSGGADHRGRLPWDRYFAAIKKVKHETHLHISAHTGFPDQRTCRRLKAAGVDQALIDVMGDEKTASQIYHLDRIGRIVEALEGIKKSGIPLIPHIVAGLFYGNIKGEYKALDIIREYGPEALVIVVFTPLKDTPMGHVKGPPPLEVARLIADARLMMPTVPIALGCERPRTREGRLIEKLAILAGANRMAVWSSEAIEMAGASGLRARFQATCCSLPFQEGFSLKVPL